MIPMFKKLLIETHSMCNRECATCLRQNDPTKSRWIRDQKRDFKMPEQIVYNIIDQAVNMDFKGQIGLVWFNEPLLDLRLPEFARYVKESGLYVYTTTNGNFLTPRLAKELDGVLNHICISQYGESKKTYFRKLFKKTKIAFEGKHVVTHYSPDPLLKQCLETHRLWACLNTMQRMIITYSGEMALCCEDIACNWNLGNVRDNTLQELWYSPRHQKIAQILQLTGNRYAYEFCENCPTCGVY